MATKSFHLCINIKNCLQNNSNKQLEGMFQDDNGLNVHPEKARAYLHDCLSKGWKVIPFGDCDNFDYQTGCGGHLEKEE